MLCLSSGKVTPSASLLVSCHPLYWQTYLQVPPFLCSMVFILFDLNHDLSSHSAFQRSDQKQSEFHGKVSGCNLNVSFIDLVVPLLSNPITILLARGCGITGEVKSPWLASSSLWYSLQLFDLSGNRLDAVHAWPAKLRLDVSHNEIPLRVSRDVIKSAAKSGTDLWMMNTELANKEDIMSNCSNELQMEEMWISRETGGYWCHDLIQPNFRVTPERFLPQLMCACGPGHFGAGTNCSACPEDTFNDQMDQRKCQACPEGGKAPAGSQALSACECPFGAPRIFENQTMCLCDRSEALTDAQKCVSCSENHVVCSPGADRLATAPLKDGYIRLKEPSEEIFKCLDPKHCRNSRCVPGLGRVWMEMWMSPE